MLYNQMTFDEAFLSYLGCIQNNDLKTVLA